MLVQSIENFHFKQSFASLGRPHLLYYMTLVFQLYIVNLIVFTLFLITKKNGYFHTITILVQNIENFHFKLAFLGRTHLLYYMTFVFQIYIVILLVFMIFLLQSKWLFLHNHYISSRYGKISL